jgi:hypothetical protein
MRGKACHESPRTVKSPLPASIPCGRATNPMIKQLLNLHEAFFENDIGNKVVVGIGFAIGAASCLLVLAIYML